MLLRKRHPLEQQAEEIAETIRGKLTRMGLRHRAKGRDYDEIYQVEFRQIEASPQFVKLRVDIDLLPEGVTTAKLSDPVVLNDLGHTLGHAVTWEDRDKKQGCWFVVHLGERDGIPRHVPFRDFVQSYPINPAPLTVPIGQGLTGPVWRDLRDFPHLLIAGATGKGKSVMVHAILASLLHLPPARMRLVLADLKGGMTLGKYKRMPHVSREHYVRRSDELPLVLLALQHEMQRRAEAMENIAEDIDEWNAVRAQKWPYLVVIIEELANAMLSKERIKIQGRTETVANATERLLADIAARGRAMGIHLVTTTQSPRSDVISGIIKANFPVRIAFGTANDMDSRVIIDDSRAQGLDKGRMIFLDCADMTMLQAPFLSEEDRAEILKRTLAGDPWLKPKTPEQRLNEEIRLILDVAQRDFAGIIDLDKLSRAPDIRQNRLKPDRLKECLAVLVADGVVRKMFMSRNYRVNEGDWGAKYPAPKVVLSDWEGSIPVDEDGIIEGEVINVNTSPIPSKLLPIPVQYQEGNDWVNIVRRWDSLGYSRNEMATRMGMDRNKALNIIREVLGPAQRGKACSRPSSVPSPVPTDVA